MSSNDKSKELGEAATTQTDKESAIILGSTFSSLDANFEGEVTVDAITGGHVFYSGAAEGHATVGEFLKAYAPVEKANPEHDRKLPEWSSTDSFVADQEGWNLFNLDESRQHGEIQADDEAGVFATDAEAVAFVRQSAEAGSMTAAKALKLAGLSVPEVAFVPSANGVARLICDEIVTYLSKKQLDAVRGIGIKDDAGKRDVDDFCDTNMVIHAAFERFGIHDSDVIMDRYMTIWNDAWDLASGVVFRSEALPPLTAEESRVVQEVVRRPGRSLTVPRVGVPVDTNPATIDRKLPEATAKAALAHVERQAKAIPMPLEIRESHVKGWAQAIVHGLYGSLARREDEVRKVAEGLTNGLAGLRQIQINQQAAEQASSRRAAQLTELVKECAADPALLAVCRPDLERIAEMLAEQERAKGAYRSPSPGM